MKTVTEKFLVEFRSEVKRRSLRSIAKQTGIDIAGLSRINSGQTKPNADTLDKLCEMLGLDLVKRRRK